MSVQPYNFDRERLGRRRFPDNKQFRAQLNTQASLILSALLDLLPSNYPKDENTNLAILYRILAREAARQLASMGSINDDKVYAQTRIEHLQQVLGERLFLYEQIAPANYNDVLYREYLIAIKNAFLEGSKKSVIENLASEFTKQKINLKELFLEARKSGSSYDVTDTHRMIVEVFVEDLLNSGRDLATLDSDLAFFINISKPAHVLYDTNFIWTEHIPTNSPVDVYFGDTGAGCVPLYITTPLTPPLVLAKTIIVDPSGTEVITGIDTDASVINFGTDATPFYAVIEPGVAGTNFFKNQNGIIRRILFSDLAVDQTVNLTSLDIPGSFNFYYPPPDLTGAPGILSDNTYQQYYQSIYRKGAFQEFVEKERDFRGLPNLTVGDSTTSLDVTTGSVVLNVNTTSFALTVDQPVSIVYDSTTQMLGTFVSYNSTTKDLTVSIDSTLGVGTHSDWTIEAYSGRFPLNKTTSPGHVCDRWVHDTLQPLYEDLRKVCSSKDTSDTSRSFSITLSERMWSPRWAWESYPGFYIGRAQSGDLYRFSVNTLGLVLTDSSGNSDNTQSVINDITVFRDGILIPGAVESFDLNPVIGGSFTDATIDYGVHVFIIEPEVSLSVGNRIKLIHDSSHTMLGAVGSYNKASGELTTVIDSILGTGNYAEWALESYNPSISLYDTTDYWDSTGGGIPHIGTEFQFSYFAGFIGSMDSTMEFGISSWQLPRAPITNGDGSSTLAEEENVQVFLDGSAVPGAIIYLEPIYGNVILNSQRSFWMNAIGKVPSLDQTLSFKYYTGGSEYYSMILDDLGHVLDDQISLDTDSSYGKFAVPANQPLEIGYKFRADLLHHASVLNSGIWNSDTNAWEGSTLLLDNYQKPATRASLANMQDSLDHYNYFLSPEFLTDTNPKKILNDQYLDQTSEAVLKLHAGTPPFQKTYSYQPRMIEQRKLQDIREHHSPLMYADLLMKETRTGDPEVTLSSICDSGPFDIGIGFKENMDRISECGPWMLMDTSGLNLDSEYVFPERCYNGFRLETATFYQEYINFLSDYGDGIVFKYLNKDTLEVEEHVFTGPVFETYDADEDEISAIASFPNALVRLTKPLNPLNILEDYKFLNDSAIRIRKKTLKELLPDRTFRTTKIYEALPV